ncbi:MAG: MBL fold metallo-hydrolase [Actinomycetia bacterium]|nr:MBL fold metallo-hydrolase [Actinomycetes bacterium]
MNEDRFYFRQLLAGRDFATDNQLAVQMVNFVYLIGDRSTGEVVVVDPAYDIGSLLDVVEADGMKLTGALATHYHADHIGGAVFGHEIEGVHELLEKVGVKVHIQRAEQEWVKKSSGLSDTDLALHDSGDIVQVGDIKIELIHTPGHTPGSQCFLVNGHLVSGDTLFLDGCGRTDLPGADPEQMYESLNNRLSKVPDDCVLFPGHRYSFPSSSTMGVTRETNFVFRPKSKEQWLMMFGVN